MGGVRNVTFGERYVSAHENNPLSSLVPGGEDTIAAISTPLGQGGIGIVRMSGTRAFEIASMLFRDKRGRKTRFGGAGRAEIRYGFVYDLDEVAVDEVLVLSMPGPRSYTREDIVEFHCHGGIAAVRKVLDLMLAQGARLAEPGEFTRRAFVNGRIDLAQAESVLEIVRARSDEGLKVAVGQLLGRLSERIKEMSQRLLGVIGELEGGIDFPEDIPELPGGELLRRLGEIENQIYGLIEKSETGRVLQEGPRVAIGGRPNVGKSSLLNRLVQEERVIVTDVPGTTRDVIEERMSLRGTPVMLVDMAGFRETGDVVERIGVERAIFQLREADLVLLVLDDSTGITEDDLRLKDIVKDRTVITVINKVDLGRKRISEKVLDGLGFGGKRSWVSAKSGYGIDDLEKEIAQVGRDMLMRSVNDAYILSARQRECLKRAQAHVREGKERMAKGWPVEILLVELRDAWKALGEITGEVGVETILDEIFGRFCVGK